MYAGQRILIVVPARGGSKGIPLKNLQRVGGRSLVARVADVVRELPWVDRAVVSTDHADIARVARDAGLEAPFYRPPELSGDRIGDLDVLTHALGATEALDGQRYDVVVMLQPTSPLRTPEHVTATLDRLVERSLDAVWTLSRTDMKSHPRKQLIIGDDGLLSYWDPGGAHVIARQQLTSVYHRNGAAYALTRHCLLEQRTMLGARSGALIIDAPMISIDTPGDIEQAEAALRADDSLSAPPGRSPQAGEDSATFPDAGGPTRTFVVDIDGVIASLVPDNDYTKAQPMRDNIHAVNALHARGHRIVLFTARGSATGRDWSRVTESQLADWGVSHHELRFGKPAADYYIDDRMIDLPNALRLTGIDTE